MRESVRNLSQTNATNRKYVTSYVESTAKIRKEAKVRKVIFLVSLCDILAHLCGIISSVFYNKNCLLIFFPRLFYRIRIESELTNIRISSFTKELLGNRYRLRGAGCGVRVKKTILFF